LEPCTWDEALGRVAAEAARLRARYGPDAVAVFGGGGLTNEKAYQLGRFARAFGLDRGLPGPVTDLAASGAVLLAGGNVAETMPPFMRHLAAMHDGGGALVVVDPRRTATARQADLHLQPAPGTDIALANGLLHLVLAEGLADEDYIAARTTGFDAVRTVV